MASRGTTSGLNDWPQFYLQDLSGQVSNTQASNFRNGFTDAMAGTSTVISTSPPSPCSQGDTSPFSGNLNPEGRVSKPARRRSRASRRTPTTLVNTDPSNFRAMVQQFTGSPGAAFAAEPQYPGGTNMNFRFGINHQTLSTNAVNFQQQEQRQAHEHLQVQLQQHMFSSINGNPDGAFYNRSNNS